jgi:branched-subunit amino acid ABC-type transport system permease component
VGLWVASSVYGLIAGATLAIAALGFNLQFGVVNYANFAYGPFLTFAAYMAYTFSGSVFHFGFWGGEASGVVATAAMSFLIGQFVFTPFFKRRPQLLFGLAVTFSVAVIMDSMYTGIWGSYVHEVNPPAGALDVHRIGSVYLTNLDLSFVALAILVCLVTWVTLSFTKLGRSMRAMSDNTDLARVCGLPTTRITALTWIITGAIAGIAGVAYQLQVHSFDPTMGDQVFYLMVAAVIFGGIGRPFGAVLGALVIGLVSQLSVLVVGEAYSTVSVFVVLVVLMLARPDGVFGPRARSVFTTA